MCLYNMEHFGSPFSLLCYIQLQFWPYRHVNTNTEDIQHILCACVYIFNFCLTVFQRATSSVSLVQHLYTSLLAIPPLIALFPSIKPFISFPNLAVGYRPLLQWSGGWRAQLSCRKVHAVTCDEPPGAAGMMACIVLFCTFSIIACAMRFAHQREG